MGGHTGNQRTTLQNLEVIDVRAKQNLLLIKGAVPGSGRGLLLIRGAKKKRPKVAG
jgi:large subunit ribosomal protein L3